MATLSNITISGQLKSQDRWFIVALSAYGCALGYSIVMINLLARASTLADPQRLQIPEAIPTYGAGAMAGIFAAGLVAYAVHLGGHDWPLTVGSWMLLSIGFALIFSLVAGGLFLPIAVILVDFLHGQMDPIELVLASTDALARSPVQALIGGVPIMFTSVVGSLLFGPVAWIIDRFHYSDKPTTSRYAPISVATLIGLGILVVFSILPTTLLARLG